MNRQQEQQWTRARERAARAGLQVSAKGLTCDDGRTVYCVPSSSEANRWHLVVVNGSRLVCDCKAAANGQYCAHRAVVRDRIITDRTLAEISQGPGRTPTVHEQRNAKQDAQMPSAAVRAIMSGGPVGPRPTTNTAAFSVFAPEPTPAKSDARHPYGTERTRGTLTKLECMDCGRKFSRRTTSTSREATCPKCHSRNVDQA